MSCYFGVSRIQERSRGELNPDCAEAVFAV